MLIFLLSTLLSFSAFAEETFILLDGEKSVAFGPSLDERFSPCSSFKVVLSLIGFESGILQDEEHPCWEFQASYDVYLEKHRANQTPRSWMKYSCLWYSKILALKLGWDELQRAVDLIDYGNKDLSDMAANAVWVSSSLKISPLEQAAFMQKLANDQLPFSSTSLEMTKRLLFREELPNGWKLYGKTGLSTSLDLHHTWFIGWIEKEGRTASFAYLLRDKTVDLEFRTRRVKELLK